MIYNDEIRKNVPRLTGQVTRKKDWLNKRFEIARKRDIAKNHWRRGRNSRTSEGYIKKARNGYVEIRSEEMGNFQKNMIEKCKERPKPFYRYVKQSLYRIGSKQYDSEGAWSKETNEEYEYEKHPRP